MMWVQVENMGKYWIFPLAEGRTYIASPSMAPKGVAVRRGVRGGYYYEEPVRREEPKKEPTTQPKVNKINYLANVDKDLLGRYVDVIDAIENKGKYELDSERQRLHSKIMNQLGFSNLTPEQQKEAMIQVEEYVVKMYVGDIPRETSSTTTIPVPIQPIFSDYDTPEKAKGKCHEAADKLIRHFKAEGRNDYKIHSFRVLNEQGQPVALNHVVVSLDGVYYNPTYLQFPGSKKVFTEEDKPKNYVSKGEIKNWFNTNLMLPKGEEA